MMTAHPRNGTMAYSVMNPIQPNIGPHPDSLPALPRIIVQYVAATIDTNTYKPKTPSKRFDEPGRKSRTVTPKGANSIPKNIAVGKRCEFIPASGFSSGDRYGSSLIGVMLRAVELRSSK